MKFGKRLSNSSSTTSLSRTPSIAKRLSALAFVALLATMPFSYMVTSGEEAIPTILPALSVTAIGYEPGSTNVPENIIDGDLVTRWSNEGKGSWITLNMDSAKMVNYLDIAWFRGDIRKTTFEISVSTDGDNFTPVFYGTTSGGTTNFETADFPDTLARHVKIAVYGNTQNNWSSINEVRVYGMADVAGPLILAPADMTVEANGPMTEVSIGTPTVIDDMDPSPVVTNDAPAAFPMDTTSVIWTATDASGNISTAVQSITVRDTTAPAIIAPPDITIESTGTLTPVALGMATAADLVDPSPVIANDAPIRLPTVTPDETYPVTHMSDTTASFGLSMHSGRQAHVEVVTEPSQLVGKSIDQITLRMKKVGSPIGTAQIGVFNVDLSVHKLFGNLDVSKIAKDYTDYTFALSGDELYRIEVGDKIGIKYSGGSYGNYVAVSVDQDSKDTFDGANAYLQYYTTYWQSFPNYDMYMVLKQTHGYAAESTSAEASPDPVFPVGTTIVTWTVTDASGNTSTASQNVTVIAPAITKDRFGIAMIYKTIPSGREWYSNWDNGKVRTLLSGERDPYNSELVARGDGTVKIDGLGIATMSGNSPRMYVYDVQKSKTWTNTELTFYAKRISETKTLSYQGFVAGSRTNHQDAHIDPCLGAGYYGRMLYDGRINFQKEIVHHGAYSETRPGPDLSTWWSTPDKTLPKNTWVGYKFVLKTVDGGQNVKLELYRDLTDGKDGGDWKKLMEYTDKGGWGQYESGLDVQKTCGIPEDAKVLWSGVSAFIRNDAVSSVQYKMFSIREVA